MSLRRAAPGRRPTLPGPGRRVLVVLDSFGLRCRCGRGDDEHGLAAHREGDLRAGQDVGAGGQEHANRRSITQDGSKVSIDISGAVDGSNQQMVAEMPEMGKVTMLVVGAKELHPAEPELVKTLGQEAVLKPYVGKWIALPEAQAKSMGSTRRSRSSTRCSPTRT